MAGFPLALLSPTLLEKIVPKVIFSTFLFLLKISARRSKLLTPAADMPPDDGIRPYQSEFHGLCGYGRCSGMGREGQSGI